MTYWTLTYWTLMDADLLDAHLLDADLLDADLLLVYVDGVHMTRCKQYYVQVSSKW